MSNLRNKRHTFRPTLDGTLEDRVVLNAARPAQALLASRGMVSARDVAQARAVYSQQFRAASNELRTYIRQQVATAYASGRPTSQQIADLNANIAGAVNATSLRLSSQYSLLPSANNNLANNLQRSLLSNANNSLVSRISTATNRGANQVSSLALNQAINRQLDPVFRNSFAQLGSFFSNNNFNRYSVATDGTPVQLGQFMGQRALNQFTNNYGALANAFNTSAQNALYANGTPNQAALDAFATQTTNAFNTSNFQLGSALAVLPGVANSNLASQLRNGIYGNNQVGEGATVGLFGSLGTLGASTDYQTFLNGANSAFNQNFSTLATPLASFSNLSTPTSFPTSNFTSVLGSNLTSNNFNSGFNTGFGSGFSGFGQAPTSFNTNFGTGYNSLITGANPILGFNSSIGGPGGVNIGTGPGGTTGTNTGLPGGTVTGGGGSGIPGGGYFS